MTGPQPQTAFLLVKRREERNADHMVEMRVREKDISIDRTTGLVDLGKQMLAERHETCATVENQQMRATMNFQTGRIAAIADELRSRTCQGSAHAPEAQREIS